MLGYAIVSAAGAQFLGGGLNDVVARRVDRPGGRPAGARVQALHDLLARLRAHGRVCRLGARVDRRGARSAHVDSRRPRWPASSRLLPGLTTTVAMTELASRHLSSGTRATGGAFIVFAAMASGVALGTTVVSAIHGGPIRSAASGRALPDVDAICGAGDGADLGFSLLLRARPRDIPLVAAASWLGYLGFHAGADRSGPGARSVDGALTVGLASNLFERSSLVRRRCRWCLACCCWCPAASAIAA